MADALYDLTEAAILSAIDYKRTFAKTYASGDHENEARSQCHTRSAQRVLKALLANGGQYCSCRSAFEYQAALFVTGIFIKLGQHMASL